jgi:hypothetical protein
MEFWRWTGERDEARELGRQVHHLENPLGDSLGLDESDKAELEVAFRADELPAR